MRRTRQLRNQYIILLLTLLVAPPAECHSQSVTDTKCANQLRQLCEAWTACFLARDDFQSAEWTSITPAGTTVDVQWMSGQLRFQSFSSTEGGGQFDAIRFTNKKYGCELRPSIDAATDSTVYELIQLSEKGTPGYNKLVNQINQRNRHTQPVQMVGYSLIDVLDHATNVKCSQVATSGDERVNFEVEIDDGVSINGKAVHISKVLLDVENTSKMLPTLIILHFRLPDGRQLVAKKEISGWHSGGGGEMWRTFDWETVDQHTNSVTKVISTTLESESIGKHRGQCWLKYYGIPEPNFGTNRPPWTVGLGIAGLVLLLLAGVIRRRAA